MKAPVNALPRPNVARRPAPKPPVARAQIVSVEPEVETRAPTAEPVRSASPRPQAKSALVPMAQSFVAVSDGDLEELDPLRPEFFATLNRVRAVPSRSAPPRHGLVKSRGYSREDLLAIGEIAYHYLMSGGVRLSLALFEGLNAVAPDEPYFAMGIALCHDHLGAPKESLRWYGRASELDPGDGRPEINAAELYIEARDMQRARQHLIRGCNKARSRGDEALERKSIALLRHLDRLV